MTSQKKNEICRLCLILDDAKYVQLDEISKETLKAVIPELNLDVPSDFVVCSKCSESIEDCFNFKTIISKNQDLIRLEKEKLKISEKVDLNDIFKTDDSKTGSNENNCRFCLNKNEGKYTGLNNIATEVFETCLLELDKDLTVNPVICELCHKGLQDMHCFKTECLSVEKKIKSYCESVSDGKIDLHKVLSASKDEDNDFLAGFEIQDEDGGDIFDSIPSELDISRNDRKRPASESAVVESSKKTKLNNENFNIAEDGLPRFTCQFAAIYNPYKTESVGEWLAKVEEIKVKEKWSDYITINKVLARMKNLNELCTWFSNISDIMNWEEWKKKLINAFPSGDDCAFGLKRMLDRKKKAHETFVAYYNAKLQLLEPHNIVGEKAVSCILGGITNHVIASIGRVGQYKTPEELLIYFKSCDDKAALESTQTNTNNKNSVQLKGKSNEKRMNKPQCSKCHKSGHNSEMCKSKTPTATNSASSKRVVQANKEAIQILTCTFCKETGHKRAKCMVRQKEGRLKARKQSRNMNNNSTNANTNSSPSKPNTKKGPTNQNTIKGPNTPNTNKGPAKPNVNKGSSKSNTKKAAIKPNTNNESGKTNVANSPTGTNGNRRPNRSNRTGVPIGLNKNRSPNRPGVNRGRNRPSMSRGTNRPSMNRGTNRPIINRSLNAPSMNRSPNVSYMNRSSNGMASNRGLNEVACSSCGNLGHTMANCLFSNLARQIDTLRLDRQSDGLFLGSSGGRDGSGQSYAGSYSDRKELSNNRRLCLNCYQMGHDTKDCFRYNRRPYAR